MKSILLPFSILALACGAAPKPEPTPPAAATAPTIIVDGEPRVLLPPLPKPSGQPGIVSPGPSELGDYYVLGADAPVTLTLTREVWASSKGAVVTVDQCATSAQLTAYTWPRTSAPSLPPPTAIAHAVALASPGSSVTVPVSAQSWVAIQLDGAPDALPCLAGVTLSAPLPAGREYWCRAQGGACLDMAVGGGSPQCSGPCPWYTTLRTVSQ